MTTTAIIAEDEPILRAQLKAKLAKMWPELQIVADVGDGEAALEAIDQLPPRCREIFRLAALDHLPASEIARRTGLAENTVYAQLAIGVRKCSDFLRERGERT